MGVIAVSEILTSVVMELQVALQVTVIGVSVGVTGVGGGVSVDFSGCGAPEGSEGRVGSRSSCSRNAIDEAMVRQSPPFSLFLPPFRLLFLPLFAAVAASP